MQRETTLHDRCRQCTESDQFMALACETQKSPITSDMTMCPITGEHDLGHMSQCTACNSCGMK